MVFLNARCDDCKTVFPTPLEIEDCEDIMITGGDFGPCPKCKGFGPLVLDNVHFSVINGHVSIGRGTISREDLMVIASVFVPFRTSARSKKAAQQAVEKVLPELASQTRSLSQNELVAIILMILAAVQAQLNSNGASMQMDQLMHLVRNQTNIFREQSGLIKDHLEDTTKQHEKTQSNEKPRTKAR